MLVKRIIPFQPVLFPNTSRHAGIAPYRCLLLDLSHLSLVFAHDLYTEVDVIQAVEMSREPVYVCWALPSPALREQTSYTSGVLPTACFLNVLTDHHRWKVRLHRWLSTYAYDIAAKANGDFQGNQRNNLPSNEPTLYACSG